MRKLVLNFVILKLYVHKDMIKPNKNNYIYDLYPTNQSNHGMKCHSPPREIIWYLKMSAARHRYQLILEPHLSVEISSLPSIIKLCHFPFISLYIETSVVSSRFLISGDLV